MRAGGQRPPRGKPFVDWRADMPPEVTKKPRKGRAIDRQTVDLTDKTAAVDDTHPHWSRNEQYILFQSNRSDLNGTQAPGNLTHIYRMSSAGGVPTALTGPLATPAIGPNTSQSEPALNANGNLLVYIETDSSGVDLIELNVNTRTTRSLLRSRDPSFTGLNNPEYGVVPGGNIGVIFAGQKGAGQPYKIYALDTQSSNPPVQLTTGISDDRNPTLSPTDAANPNKLVIAFDSNRTNADGSAIGPTRDIWAIGIAIGNPNAVRLTNFAVGGVRASNIQPAWSTNKVDQVNGSQSFVGGQQLIAFASTRYDTNGDGNANGINPNGTHDIYWLKVTISPDPNNPSLFTVTNPESRTNPALKLVTSDPNHVYNDLHPTWPQFIRTYQVAYHSDRTFHDSATNDSGPPGQPNDIFASTLLDINAPTLVRFNRSTGDVVSIEPRLSAPGSTVKISVKLYDFETGIRDVWAQIKNPNSKYQSADGREHKVYAFGALSPDGTNAVLNVPIEYDSQRLFVGNNPNDPRRGSYADPSYVASISDFFAFSGLDNPPDEGWLQLVLEGPDPQQPGVSIYSATFQTPQSPSDYYVDIIAYDNAVDPFSAEAANWKIYDNIWGFSTQSFHAEHGILFVSDYAAGQKFFNSRFGLATLANVYPTFWGTESWLTDMDTALFPTAYVPLSGGTGGTVYNVLNTLGVRSMGADTPADIITSIYNYDPLMDDGTRTAEGEMIPVTQQYDIWRILSRGPLPDSVLREYLPRMERQPADPINGVPERDVVVAERCVIWHAPYTGNLFTGQGTITDLVVQNQLHNFLTLGGRLFVNGQDIGWALTLNGTTGNTFLSGDLRATYLSDDVTGSILSIVTAGSFPALENFSAALVLTAKPQYNPITNDPWRGPKTFQINPTHYYVGPPWPTGGNGRDHYVSAHTNHLIAGPSPSQPRDYACLGVIFPDVIQAFTDPSNPTTDITYGGGGGAMQHYNGGNFRVIYCPSGLEGHNSEADGPPPGFTNAIVLNNRRAELVHNAVCWLRTGTVFGTITDTESNPVPNAIVRLHNTVDAQGRPIIKYTGITDPAGNFVINGVDPEQYLVTVSRAGFAQHAQSINRGVHGGWRTEVSFQLTPAEPAIIKGKVMRTDGTTPISGATVTARDNAPPNETFTATTDTDGNYSLRVPSGTTYTITATHPDYGESIPIEHVVTVQASQVYEPYDFRLKPIPGIVTGRVLKRADNSPIKSAVVTATMGTTDVTAITDVNGEYRFDVASNNGLDPGVWALVATAPGFSPNTAINVTVISNQTVNAPDILLDPVPPGSVSGLVTRTSDGQALAGALIELRDAGGDLVASATTVAPQTVNGYTFNFKIDNVPAGATYTATASKSGFTPNPTSRKVTVVTGEETKNVNFQMEPLHTFSGSLSMVSAPYTYTQDIGDLLSIPAADRVPGGPFRFATWAGTRYAYYPNAPANTFTLGRGYFLAYKNNLPLSIEGTSAPQNVPFDIPVNAGWSMIGDPFPFDIDWTKVKVIYNAQVLDHDAAVAQGLVGASLYTYIGGGYVLDFRLTPWRGHWVRAYQNVVLRIDPQTDRLGRAAPIKGGNSRAVLYGGDGWSVNLRVNVGEYRDEDNYFGVTGRAVDGFDRFKAQKPPIVGDRFVYLAFDHDDWGDKSGPYGVDVRSATAAPKTWEFSVQTNVPNTAATLSWPNAATVGRNVMLTLTDLTTGAVRDLRTTSSYTWNTGDTPGTRRFKIEATTAGRNDFLRVTSVVAQTANANRAAGVNIAFNLSMAANVDVRIVGANGAQVRRLIGRATRAAGVNQTTWDRKNDRGVVMPAGSYTIEIRAQTTDGKQTVRAIAPLLLTR